MQEGEEGKASYFALFFCMIKPEQVQHREERVFALQVLSTVHHEGKPKQELKVGTEGISGSRYHEGMLLAGLHILISYTTQDHLLKASMAPMG